MPRNHLLTETEWRNLGIQQSVGWVHYVMHHPEPHILMFRRPLDPPAAPAVAEIMEAAEVNDDVYVDDGHDVDGPAPEVDLDLADAQVDAEAKIDDMEHYSEADDDYEIEDAADEEEEFEHEDTEN